MRKKIAIALVIISLIFGAILPNYLKTNAGTLDNPIINTSSKGSLTIYKYETDDLSQFTTPGTGETETVTETDTTKPLSGVTFQLYKVGDVDTIQTSAPNPETYQPDSTKLVSTKITNDSGVAQFDNLDLGRYYAIETSTPENVSVKTAPFFVDVPTTNAAGTSWIYDVKVYPKNQTVYGAVILTITDADDSTIPLKGTKYDLYQTELNGTALTTPTKRLEGVTTNSNGQVIIENLPVGKYFFVETSAATDYIIDNVTKHEFEITASGTVQRNGTDADATVVTPINPNVAQVTDTNNKELKIDKFVKEQGTKTDTQDVDTNNNQINQNVKWIINTTIPTNIDIYTEYKISDTLKEELTYVEDSITLKIGNTDLVKDTDYTVTVNENQIEISFKNSGFAKAKEALKVTGTEQYKTADLIVTYETIINNKGLTELTKKIKNTATLDYKISTDITNPNPVNAPETVIETSHSKTLEEDKQPEVHTGGYTFIKVNSSEEPLSGAEFKISKVKNPTSSDYLSAYNEENTLTSTFISDNDGYVVIKGLAYGDYYLVEVKAPTDSEGKSYNLLKESKKITIDDNSHLTATGYKITNKMGPVLPITGGMGTVVVIVAGVIILAVGIILFKKGNKKE